MSENYREATACSGRGGVGQEFLASTTPSARFKEASQYFFDRAATLLG